MEEKLERQKGDSSSEEEEKFSHRQSKLFLALQSERELTTTFWISNPPVTPDGRFPATKNCSYMPDFPYFRSLYRVS